MITALALLWILLTFGLTYLATQAEVLEPARVRIVAWMPWTAILLSCRACTSFWTAQTATVMTMAIACDLGTCFPWYAWIYLPPVGGVAAVGLIDLIAFAKHGGYNAQADARGERYAHRTNDSREPERSAEASGTGN